jgi:hypothetical protein
MAFALGVEPVGFSGLILVVDVAGERLGRRRGCRWRDSRLRRRRLSRRCHMGADSWDFAGPFFERLLPGQGDQPGGDDEFEEEAHGGDGEKLSVIGYQLSGGSSKLLTADHADDSDGILWRREVRRRGTLAEKIGMGSGPLQAQLVRKKAVNQYPVRFEVAVAAPHPLAQ